MVEIRLGADGSFILRIRGERGSHEVQVGRGPHTLAIIERILIAAERDPKAKIGWDAAPTQHQVKAWLAALAAGARAPSRKERALAALQNIEL
jgi:hypothetical protein